MAFTGSPITVLKVKTVTLFHKDFSDKDSGGRAKWVIAPIQTRKKTYLIKQAFQKIFLNNSKNKI